MTTLARTCLALALCACAVGGGPSSPSAGSASSSFNLFTPEQDVEIGRQSAAEAEKQLPMLGDSAADRYVDGIVQTLAAQAPGAKYPYRAKAVNDPSINAFALPGGPLYVNRGLIEAARSEDELAGVMAHEVAHVALRHGTHQASKAYLAQAGLGILGGLLGQDSANTAQVINVIGGVGLNVLFLKYSRDAESEADATGAQIMARAGYDPVAMADFFELLRQKEGSSGSVATFFSDHPAPADREARIRQLAATSRAHRRDAPAGSRPFRPSCAACRRPRSRGSRRRSAHPARPRSDRDVLPPVQVPRRRRSSRRSTTRAASSRSTTRQTGRRTRAPATAHRLPPGGAVDTGDGESSLVYGVVVNHYAPFEAGRKSASLADARDDLVQTIQRSNPYLKVVSGSARSEQIDDAPATSVVLAGPSPITNTTEEVTVVTRALRDGHVVYALLIAPQRDRQALAPAFTRMVRSLEIHDVASHP